MTRTRANLILLVVSLIWGTAFVAQKTAMPDGTAEAAGDAATVGPLTFTGVRFLLGALAVLPLALREGMRAPVGGIWPGTPWVAGWAGTGGLLFAAAFAQQRGLLETSVTNAGFLTAVYVTFVPGVAWLLFRRRPHWVIWPGVVACLAGTWMMTGGAAGGSLFKGLGSGDLWVLAGSIFWALHVCAVGELAMRGGRVLGLATVQFLAVSALALVGAMIWERPDPAAIAALWPQFLHAGLLSVGVAFTLQGVAQRHTHPADAAVILSAETVFAALAGALVLGETMGAARLMGAGLILSGILAVELVPGVIRRAQARPSK